MSLIVALVHHIDAVAVAEFIEVGIVGVMTGAHGVDVVLLKDADILQHALARDVVPAIGVVLVAVDPFHFHRHAIDAVNAVDDLNFPKSDLPGDDFNHTSIGIQQCELELIEMRGLRRPFQGIGDRLGESAFGCRNRLLHDLSAIGSGEGGPDRMSSGLAIASDIDLEFGIAVVFIQIHANPEVLDSFVLA